MIYTPTQVVLVLAQEERPLEGVMEMPQEKRGTVFPSCERHANAMATTPKFLAISKAPLG
jgi:hypothetical protein